MTGRKRKKNKNNAIMYWVYIASHSWKERCLWLFQQLKFNNSICESMENVIPHWSKAGSFLLSHLAFSAYLSILSLASALTILKPSSTSIMESTLQNKNHLFCKYTKWQRRTHNVVLNMETGIFKNSTFLEKCLICLMNALIECFNR